MIPSNNFANAPKIIDAFKPKLLIDPREISINEKRSLLKMEIIYKIYA